MIPGMQICPLEYYCFTSSGIPIVHLCCSCRDCLKSLMQPWGMPITFTPAVLVIIKTYIPIGKKSGFKSFQALRNCSQFLLHRLLWSSNRKAYFIASKQAQNSLVFVFFASVKWLPWMHITMNSSEMRWPELAPGMFRRYSEEWVLLLQRKRVTIPSALS